jgi:hypothetical protein
VAPFKRPHKIPISAARVCSLCARFRAGVFYGSESRFRVRNRQPRDLKSAGRRDRTLLSCSYCSLMILNDEDTWPSDVLHYLQEHQEMFSEWEVDPGRERADDPRIP